MDLCRSRGWRPWKRCEFWKDWEPPAGPRPPAEPCWFCCGVKRCQPPRFSFPEACACRAPAEGDCEKERSAPFALRFAWKEREPLFCPPCSRACAPEAWRVNEERGESAPRGAPEGEKRWRSICW